MALQVKTTKPEQTVRQQIEELRMKFVPTDLRLHGGVMDECLYKMDVLCLLPLNPERVTLRLGESAAACLAEHVNQCEALEPERTTRGIQDTLLNFLRMVRPYGTAIQTAGPVEMVVGEDQRAVQELREGLRDLRAISWDRLRTTGAEEQELRRRAQEVVTRLWKNVQRIEELERKVTEAEQDRDEELRKKDEEIRHLKGSLQEVEETTEDYVMHKQLESSKRSQKDQKKSEEKSRRLQQEANRLRVQLNDLVTEHQETRKEPRERNDKLEAEIQNRVQIYDKAMSEEQVSKSNPEIQLSQLCSLQEELESLRQIYEQEKAEFCELQQRYTLLQPEYCEIMEVQRRIQQQREEEVVKNRAAIVIQVFWRRWRLHKGMEKRVKPGSMKGKRGKGKKGK